MADAHLATPGPDELQESLPTRDFVRPAGSPAPRAMAVLSGAVPLPRAWQVLSDEQAVATLVATVAVLLHRHARRDAVALVLRRSAAGGLTLQPLRVEVGSARTFDELLQSLQQSLRQVPTVADATAHDRGVVIDVTDPTDIAAAATSTPAPADVAIRIAIGDRSHADLCYDTGLFRAESVVPMARQLTHLLAEAMADGGRAPADLPLMDAAERERVRRGFNALRVPFPLDRTLADLIDEQCARTPDRVCAVHGPQSLTFAELDRRAGRLAQLLLALGAGPGTFVAIVDRRGIDFAIAMVAIWKAGAAYIPVDPGYPAERVRLMLADSEAPIAVVGPDALARFAAVLADCPALCDLVCTQGVGQQAPGRATQRLHDARTLTATPAASAASDEQGASSEQASPAARRARATDPAYMIYTSGSTGRPKGAIVRHDGAVNHLFAQAHALGREAVARFLQSAPSSSDISVWQFAAPLAFGGTTVVVDDPTDVAHLLDQVRRYELHLIELVPAVLKHLVDFATTLSKAERALPSLRWAMVTGESAPVELVNAWLALYPDVPVVNAYGPSEASDDVAQAILRQPLPARQATVPIGLPLANLDLYVLDERLEPLPVGVPGEICIAGVGVGAGYWRQPEKTRQSFVANPFPDAAGPVIYRTGDLGRWRDDGTLECLGRLDHQVQLRGFRIELQEIEAVLRQHGSVRDAVVQAFHDGRGDGQLVAYLVEGADAAGDDALRAHLSARLPLHMVPSAFVRLPVLPLNPAGKVDRKALQAPAHGMREGGGAEAPPLGAAELALATIWQRELGVARIGRDDDFFALGGDSLAALAIVVGAREAGWQIRSADVLAQPTVARLARVAQRLPADAGRGAGAAADPAVPPLPAGEAADFLAREPAFETVWPLAPPQQGLYLHWLLARDKTAYVDRYDYDLLGALDPAAFEAAWNQVVARHPALRTAFLRSALRQPVQAVRRTLPVTLTRIDLADRPAAAQEEALRELGAADVARGFDLAQPPLMRLTLARLAPRQHRLLWTHHHIVLDGWSLALVLDEVLHAHAALAAGRTPDLGEVVPYGRYVERLAQLDIAPSLAHWREALAGRPGSPPIGLPAPAHAVRGHGETDVQLDEAATTVLAARARAAGVTLTTMLQAAWAALLGALAGQPEVVLGVVSSGRELAMPGIERAVGLFVTTLPLRLPVRDPPGNAGADAAAWLSDVQQRAAALRQHEAVPLARIARACELAPGATLFDTLFVMSNFPQPGAGGAETPLRIAPAAFRTVPAYALALVVTPDPALRLRLIHDRQQIDDAAAAALARVLVRLLEQVAAGADPRAAAASALVDGPVALVDRPAAHATAGPQRGEAA